MTSSKIERYSYPWFGDGEAPANGGENFLPSFEGSQAAPPPPPPVEETPPPPPTFSAEQLAEAEKNAYEHGKRDGEAAAQKEADEKFRKQEEGIVRTLEELRLQWQNVAKAREAWIASLSGESARLALAIACKIAGDTLKQTPLAPIEAVMQETLASLFNEEKVVVYVHEDIAPQLENRIQTLVAGLSFPGKVEVIGNPNLAPADIRMEWQNGACERNTQALIERVGEVIGRAAKPSATAAPEADGNTEPVAEAAARMAKS